MSSVVGDETPSLEGTEEFPESDICKYMLDAKLVEFYAQTNVSIFLMHISGASLALYLLRNTYIKENAHKK